MEESGTGGCWGSYVTLGNLLFPVMRLHLVGKLFRPHVIPEKPTQTCPLGALCCLSQ